MKRGIIVFITLAVFSLLRAEAQNPNQKPLPNQNPNFDKLNTYKIAFFTRRLNLTSQEERNAIQIERQTLNRNINQNELNMADKDLIEAGDKQIAFQVQEAGLAQEYHKKFKEILSPAKVIRLYQAENQYRLQLLNELKDRQPIRNNAPQRLPGRKPL
jgi:hypothetical protein